MHFGREEQLIKGTRKLLHFTVIYTGAVLLALFCLLPVMSMLSTSLKPATEYYTSIPSLLPHHLILDNYQKVFSDVRFLLYLKNSFIIAGASTIIALALAVPAGYGFSRYLFFGKGPLFLLILFVRVMPRAAILIPIFIVLRQLRLIDTYPGIVLGYFILTLPLAVWLLRGFFQSFPKEIEEAAIIDGCTSLGVLLRIVIPITLPVIFAVGMYSFVMAWNEFSLALVLSNTMDTRPVALGILYYELEGVIDMGPFMAGATVMTIPPVLVFLWFQKHLIRGLAAGALKG